MISVGNPPPRNAWDRQERSKVPCKESSRKRKCHQHQQQWLCEGPQQGASDQQPEQGGKPRRFKKASGAERPSMHRMGNKKGHRLTGSSQTPSNRCMGSAKEAIHASNRPAKKGHRLTGSSQTPINRCMGSAKEANHQSMHRIDQKKRSTPRLDSAKTKLISCVLREIPKCVPKCLLLCHPRQARDGAWLHG